VEHHTKYARHQQSQCPAQECVGKWKNELQKSEYKGTKIDRKKRAQEECGNKTKRKINAKNTND